MAQKRKNSVEVLDSTSDNRCRPEVSWSLGDGRHVAVVVAEAEAEVSGGGECGECDVAQGSWK